MHGKAIEWWCSQSCSQKNKSRPKLSKLYKDELVDWEEIGNTKMNNKEKKENTQEKQGPNGPLSHLQSLSKGYPRFLPMLQGKSVQNMDGRNAWKIKKKESVTYSVAQLEVASRIGDNIVA